MGYAPIIATQSQYGDCKQWRRVSLYGKPGSTTSAKVRFDLNSPIASTDAYYTAGFYEQAPYMLNKFNSAKGTSLTQTSIGVNTNFFDCWFDSAHQPFIHLPCPLDVSPKFNTSYDIVCNDLIIEPWQNKIYFDRWGRLHCKALVPNTRSFV